MTREEAIDYLSVLAERMDTKDTDLYVADIPLECVDMAIEALRQEPCEDTISREWLKTAIHRFYYGLKHIPTEEDIQAYIDVAPRVTPNPKTGHWEYVQYDGNPNIGNWHCSECNRIVSGAISAVNPVYAYKYCPNCGAKMESEVKE